MQSFWEEMKRFTEDAWMRTTVEKEDVYGYQIVPGTKWNRGLNPEQLAQLQRSFGFPLPSSATDLTEIPWTCKAAKDPFAFDDRSTSIQMTFQRLHGF